MNSYSIYNKLSQVFVISLIHFKSKSVQYKSPQNTDNNNTICNLRRNVYMKATGIVRRIEARVIITQKCDNTLSILGFRAIFKEKFLRKISIFDLYKAKARGNPPRFF